MPVLPRHRNCMLQCTLVIRMYRFHSRIAVSTSSVYPESYTQGIGIIDSMRSNYNREDIVVSQIVITKVHCIYTHVYSLIGR